MITKAIYMFKMTFIQKNVLKMTRLILIKAQDHPYFASKVFYLYHKFINKVFYLYNKFINHILCVVSLVFSIL